VFRRCGCSTCSAPRPIVFRGLAEDHYTGKTATDRPGLTFLPGLTDVAVDLSGLLPTA